MWLECSYRCVANSFLKSILVFGERDFIMPSTHLPWLVGVFVRRYIDFLIIIII